MITDKKYLNEIKFDLYRKRYELREERLKTNDKIPYYFNNSSFHTCNYRARVVYCVCLNTNSPNSLMADDLNCGYIPYVVEDDIIQEYTDSLYIISKVYKYKGGLHLVQLHKTKSHDKHYAMLELLTC